MKELKGTKTEKNLQEAFAGESQARNKYTYFASKAKKDGFVQIANIFEETAANEKVDPRPVPQHDQAVHGQYQPALPADQFHRHGGRRRAARLLPHR